MRNCICFNFACNNYNNDKYKNNNDTVIIIILIILIIIIMISHDFVSSFFPHVSQHVLVLSSDWFDGLRPSVMTQIHCI